MWNGAGVGDDATLPDDGPGPVTSDGSVVKVVTAFSFFAGASFLLLFILLAVVISRVFLSLGQFIRTTGQ
jgi:hypothetical protein